ncbi:MAG: PLP-dependent cysteine synthase family protein, partial [Alphaproteobacteria bacterium]
MSQQQLKKIEEISCLFGNTPLIEVVFKYKNKILKIYGKYEAKNFSGSIKDRIALHILKYSYQHNLIKEGDLIVEATSGNTGIAFSALGAHLNHKVKIIMPDWLSKERYDAIQLYGAEVVKITKEQGGFIRSIEDANLMVANHKNVYCPQQFTNIENVNAHYLSTAPEFFMQMEKFNKKPSHFVAGVG